MCAAERRSGRSYYCIGVPSIALSNIKKFSRRVSAVSVEREEHELSRSLAVIMITAARGILWACELCPCALLCGILVNNIS
jgi:hypothetical protein